MTKTVSVTLSQSSEQKHHFYMKGLSTKLKKQNAEIYAKSYKKITITTKLSTEQCDHHRTNIGDMVTYVL